MEIVSSENLRNLNFGQVRSLLRLCVRPGWSDSDIWQKACPLTDWGDRH